MKTRKHHSKFFQISLLIIIVVLLTSGSLVLDVKASPASAYNFRFNVNREGFTNVEINFYSTDVSGESWVFVPKFSRWNHTVTHGQIDPALNETVETDQVVSQKYYFYQAFRFRYQAIDFFNMTIQFDFENGALIIEPRGVFYSPQIGFQTNSDGRAEVLFDDSLQVNPDKAIAAGATGNYPASEVQLNRALFNLLDNIARIQIEFSSETSTPELLTLKSSDNETFTFKTVTRYQSYAHDVLRLYDNVYSNFIRLFNVTLDNVDVQWFLPDFETLLDVGGFIPFTGEQLGEININLFFIRAVNGTVEVIATHELTHHFTKKTGISPNNFLWFHEGMAQYLSVMIVSNLGYEGAKQEKDNLENGSTQLIRDIGENFGTLLLEEWTPSYKPPNVEIGTLYVASYYVVSRLPLVAEREELYYYGQFFELVAQLPSDFNGVKIRNISELALYFSRAANASVASTLRRWGFTVTDLYSSPVSELLEDAGRAIEEANPIFQPYRSLAEYFYQQGLSSAEQGDWERARSLLQLSISIANLAPFLTFLTIIVLLTLLILILIRRRKEPRPIVPPPPSEILQPSE